MVALWGSEVPSDYWFETSSRSPTSFFFFSLFFFLLFSFFPEGFLSKSTKKKKNALLIPWHWDLGATMLHVGASVFFFFLFRFLACREPCLA